MAFMGALLLVWPILSRQLLAPNEISIIWLCHYLTKVLYLQKSEWVLKSVEWNTRLGFVF